MERAFDILAIGEPLYELALGKHGAFVPGLGGDTSNCVIAARRHGARTAYATMVGDDFFGEALLDLWRREDVDISAIRKHQSAPTGLYFVISRPEGHEFIYRRQDSAASLMGGNDVPSNLIRRSKVLHVSGISQAISQSAEECVRQAILVARECGTLVSYDTNYRARLWPVDRARDVVARTLSMADIALPSLDDMRALFGAQSPDDAIDACLEMGTPIVAMTMGAAGAMAADSKTRSRFPALALKSLDATGAGDAFDGAFLAEYLRISDWAVAARYACMAASLSTLHLGAVAGLPTRAQTLAAMETGGRS